MLFFILLCFYHLYLISHPHAQEDIQKINLGALRPVHRKYPSRSVWRQRSKAHAMGNILIIIRSPGLFNLTYSGFYFVSLLFHPYCLPSTTICQPSPARAQLGAAVSQEVTPGQVTCEGLVRVWASRPTKVRMWQRNRIASLHNRTCPQMPFGRRCACTAHTTQPLVEGP